MNHVAINICLQIFVWTQVFISFGYIPRHGIAESFSNSVIFQEIVKTFPSSCTYLEIFIFLLALYEGSSFSSPGQHLHYSHSSWCEVVYHVFLICIFLITNDVMGLFMYYCPLVCLPWGNVHSDPLFIFKLDYLSFYIELFFTYSSYNFLLDIQLANFLPFKGLPFYPLKHKHF